MHLERGFTLDGMDVRSAFETKNAYFNIERLGAIVRRFTRNVYGTTSSHLHRGLPTHRCTAEWWLDSETGDERAWQANHVEHGHP